MSTNAREQKYCRSIVLTIARKKLVESISLYKQLKEEHKKFENSTDEMDKAIYEQVGKDIIVHKARIQSLRKELNNIRSEHNLH